MTSLLPKGGYGAGKCDASSTAGSVGKSRVGLEMHDGHALVLVSGHATVISTKGPSGELEDATCKVWQAVWQAFVVVCGLHTQHVVV